jgi:hypothetical protein
VCWEEAGRECGFLFSGPGTSPFHVVNGSGQAPLSLDIGAGVVNNTWRQRHHFSGAGEMGRERFLSLGPAPMSGLLFVQQAVTILIVQTRQAHHWARAPDRGAGLVQHGDPRSGGVEGLDPIGK